MMKILRNMDHEPLASFELEDDGTVTANYVSPGVKRDIEDQGLYFDGRGVRPEDGKDFMDALDLAYHRSSTAYVQTVE